MKILQLIQREQFRGVELFALQLSRQLIQRGHHVDVLVLFGDQSNLYQTAHSFEPKRYFLHANSVLRLIDIWNFWKLAVFISKGQYDIIQANAGDTLKYASLSKYLFKWNGKYIFRNASLISFYIQSYLKLWVNKLFINQLDGLVSVSKKCQDDFLDKFINFSAPSIVVPIGVDASVIDLEKRSHQIVCHLKGPVLLHVGAFTFEKNHKGLLQVFKSILAEYPTATLLLVGEGKMKTEIQQLAKDWDLIDSVQFLGKRTDVLSIMRSCTALLLPSLVEGLPGVILESLLARLPVVAFDVGGIGEVVTFSTGWLAPKNDLEKFKTHILEIISGDKNLVASKVNNAYTLIQESYLNPMIAARFEQFYVTLLSQKGDRPS